MIKEKKLSQIRSKNAQAVALVEDKVLQNGEKFQIYLSVCPSPLLVLRS